MTVTHNLELAATDEEQDGLIHFGVVYDGGFVPLGAIKAGDVTAYKTTPTGISLAGESAPPSEPPAAPAG